MLKQLNIWKKGRRGSFVLGIAALVSLFLSQASAVTLAAGQVAAGVEINQMPPGTAAVRFSAGVGDILKMAEAKVDATVIKAFIKNSPVPYNLGAAEIVALKERGVADDIITMLIQRGGELRQQPQQPARATAASPPYNSGAPYDYGAQPTQPYPEPYPDYSYAYGGYPYSSYAYAGYPYSYSYDYGYPWWPYWSSLYFGFYPYSGFRHYPYFYSHQYPYSRFNHFDGHFRGIQAFGPGHSGGFRGNTFVGQPWSSAGRNMNFHSFGGGGRSFSPMGHGGGGFHSGGISASHGGGGSGGHGGGFGGGHR